MLWAQSTTKDYIRAEHKLHSISKLFISQVIIPQVMFFEPIYTPRALNMRTCIRQRDLFYSAGLRGNHALATANTRGIGRDFGKKCSESQHLKEWTRAKWAYFPLELTEKDWESPCSEWQLTTQPPVTPVSLLCQCVCLKLSSCLDANYRCQWRLERYRECRN